MGDRRRGRGPHPADEDLFAEARLVRLRQAVADLSWLFDRGYVLPSAMKLVGDRYELRQRQRVAVSRSSCSSRQAAARGAKCVVLSSVDEVWVDGFNLLTTVEAALSGGVLIVGRDGCCRDMASMHGTYRKVHQTDAAIVQIGEHLREAGVSVVRWLLDQPVSNSGRLAEAIAATAADHGWSWQVELVRDPDQVLSEATGVTVVSADAQILDRCESWSNVAMDVAARVPNAWVCSLGDVGGAGRD